MRWNKVLGYCNWQRDIRDEFWDTECEHFYTVDGNLKLDYCPFCKKRIASYISYPDRSIANCVIY